MTDRELLELAAKAAGIGGGWGDKIEYHNGVVDLRDVWILGGDDFVPWNPLTDDGDALRLAVKLRLDIMFFEGFQEVHSSHCYANHTECLEEYGEDIMGSTRRAIVRAAAEIGKSLEEEGYD